MLELVADWTTAGPWRNLSWLTIAFVTFSVMGLILALFEMRDAYITWSLVRKGGRNGGLRILATSSMTRSLLRLTTISCFFVISIMAVYFSIALDPGLVYWYRIVFVFGLLLANLSVSALAINDISARRKLLNIIEERDREKEEL